MHVELVNPLAYLYAKRKVGDGGYPLRYGVFITGAVVTMRAHMVNVFQTVLKLFSRQILVYSLFFF
jgi:hypothetical protein